MSTRRSGAVPTRSPARRRVLRLLVARDSQPFGPRQGREIRRGRLPAEIRVGAVVRETKEDLAVMGCLAETGFCRIEGCCVPRHALREATFAFLQTLDGYTLADLLAPRARLIHSLGLATEMAASGMRPQDFVERLGKDRNRATVVKVTSRSSRVHRDCSDWSRRSCHFGFCPGPDSGRGAGFKTLADRCLVHERRGSSLPRRGGRWCYVLSLVRI
jgi:hypothetical protein